MRTSSLLVLLIASCAFALLVADAFGRPTTLKWQKGVRASANESVSLWFGLRHASSNAKLADFVSSVSTPSSESYGKHLRNPSELQKFVNVDEDLIAKGLSWCQSACQQRSDCCTISGVSRDWLRAVWTVAEIEAALGVRMFRYSHPAREDFYLLRQEDVTTSATLPTEMREIFDAVVGLTSLPEIRGPSDEAQVGLDLVWITPAHLRKLYGTPSTPVSAEGNDDTVYAQAVAEFQLQGFSARDLARFQHLYQVQSQGVRNASKGSEGILGHTEGNLDIEYIMGVAQGVATDYYLHSGTAFDLIGWVTDALDTFAAHPDTAPRVWSVSYGEALETVTVDYAQRLDVEFQKMAALGVTVLFASGDSGVWSRQTSRSDHFHPSFPAVLPHVTAVGSTKIGKTYVEEGGTDWSGGGFAYANYFNRSSDASWQDAAVQSYINSGVQLPPSKWWDSAGRAIPDVSAAGLNFLTIIDDVPVPVSGTSASCPTWAAVVSLLNQVRSKAGKSSLGFLNPFLYSTAAQAGAFHDQTEGNNADGEKYGFSATKGWDPVTGLGTPDYEKLSALM